MPGGLVPVGPSCIFLGCEFIRFVSSTDTTQAQGVPTSTPVGLSPTNVSAFAGHTPYQKLRMC